MISLAEAWGESETISAASSFISAKKTNLQPQNDPASVVETIPTETPTEKTNVYCQTVDIAQIVQELKTLRNEETNRSTVYIILICILFALLFIYIDRLNNQIKE